MATKRLLTALFAAPERTTPTVDVQLESVGGVDAAKRVAAGEAFDIAILGSGALNRLIASGRIQAGSRVDLVRSPTAVAVPAGEPAPDIRDSAAVRAAVLAARSVGYSTGPSGVALKALFERWGIADAVAKKLVTPPPGTPVAALVVRGEVALGFQQLSELQNVSGTSVIGLLPADIAITTVFAGGVTVVSREGDAARALLADLVAPWTAPFKRANGMEAPD